MNRREWIAWASASFLTARRRIQAQAVSQSEKAGQSQSTENLTIEQYTPRSMLTVAETRVERARFPVIDFHTHITSSARTPTGYSYEHEARFLPAGHGAEEHQNDGRPDGWLRRWTAGSVATVAPGASRQVYRFHGTGHGPTLPIRTMQNFRRARLKMPIKLEQRDSRFSRLSAFFCAKRAATSWSESTIRDSIRCGKRPDR